MKITEKRLRTIVREEIQNLVREDEPCWDGYTMVGTKMKDGKEVPNCVPDDDVENYED